MTILATATPALAVALMAYLLVLITAPPGTLPRALTRARITLTAAAHRLTRPVTGRWQATRTITEIIPGNRTLTGQPSRPASVSLTYRPDDPYAVSLRISTHAGSTRHVFARDLLLTATNSGVAGTGLIRLHRSGVTLILMILTPSPTTPTIETVVVNLLPVQRFLDRSLRLVPEGEERLNTDAFLAALMPGPAPRAH